MPVIKRSEVTKGLRNIRRELAIVQNAVEEGSIGKAYAAAERAQFAAFNLKSYLSGSGELIDDVAEAACAEAAASKQDSNEPV